MGNVEKLVVLTVLFLSAIVLAVSLNREEEGPGTGPLEAAQARLEGGHEAEFASARPLPQPVPVSREDESRENEATLDPGRFFLDAGRDEAPVEEPEVVEREAALPEEMEAEAARLPRILRTTRGLRPSPLQDFMVYTVSERDSWSGLAERFYDDAAYTRHLHLANEDLTSLQAGQDIMVPVYDLTQEAGIRPQWKPAPRPLGRDASGKAADEGSAETALAGGVTHEVQPGDSLSEISKEVYGTSVHWKAIFDANRGLLESPDQLDVGMRLVLPELARRDPAAPATESQETGPRVK